jgi:hypothetical protein
MAEQGVNFLCIKRVYGKGQEAPGWPAAVEKRVRRRETEKGSKKRRCKVDKGPGEMGSAQEE